MHIGILDDDQSFLQLFIAKLKQACDAFLYPFSTEEDLMNTVLSKLDYLFLDIEMPKRNGFQLAKELKESFPQLEIIFITSHEQYVYDSFSLKPFDFIPKQHLDQKLSILIKRMQDTYKKRHQLFPCYVNNCKVDILVHQIVRIEREQLKCRVYCDTTKTAIYIHGNIKDIIHQLPSNFVIISKSEIINMHEIKTIDQDKITLKNNHICYCSRRRKKAVIEAYFTYLQEVGL